MIGIFDSGLGGLSVLAAIARTLPRADLAYVADTAHVPSMERPREFDELVLPFLQEAA